MKSQMAKMMAAENAMHFYYNPNWKFWGLYHLENLDRPAEFISPRQLKELSDAEFMRLIKLVRGGV
jgi:hypothetical protein